MPICVTCGHVNSDAAKFCEACAAPVGVGSVEHRKVVTVLFCDVTGSTALGESTDPEALRALLARYFERMKAIVEWHGGAVEKFIGDAVMAVFGVPAAHEDDALRACRAAIEMRDALPELGVQARIGVNTGEVVTGTEERLATGDAVNVAARLEQAAQPEEVLIGAETMWLVQEAVEAEPVEPLELKGKRESVPAFRLVRVGVAPERVHGETFVGRERELEQIAAAWVRAGAERRCELVTIVAEAGVGKTRLAAEALEGLDARVVRGRCLSYGEGITYWPVVEVVKQLAARPSDPAAAAAIASLLGETEAGTSAEEIAWSFRKLLEEQAPLVCVFEDVHWGEETFLDLVEHVALLSSGAQVLLLCTARPELLERRHSWPVTFRLAPLEPVDVDRLVSASLPAELRDQIALAAGGNPLFVTEMVAMAESADGEVSVPPNLRALLTARLDQVDAAERRVLERGAVEGEIFHRGAVQALAPEETQVTPLLAALVRRELIRPDDALFAGEDGFRFRHLLIRDAAYDAFPKATRAELHQRYANWAEQHAELVELDEILGYHLEQAYRYQAELGQPDSKLAASAGERLAAAGRRARARGDIAATVGLLRRATSLLREGSREHPELLLMLGMALSQAGELVDADAVLAEAVDAALNSENRGLEHQALIERLGMAARVSIGSEGSVEELQQAIDRAIPVFEAAGDELGLARAYKWHAEIHNFQGGADKRAEALEEALRHAQAAGDAVEEDEIVNYLAAALAGSSTAADKAIERCVDLLARSTTGPVAEVNVTSTLAYLHGCRGEFEPAQRLIASAKKTAQEFGLSWDEARLAEHAGWISLLAGDPAAAEREFRSGCDLFEAMGERGRRATTTGWLAEAVYAQGRLDEAEQLAQLAEELGQEHYPAVQAKVMARRGKLAEAEALARESVKLARRYQSLFTLWLLDAAEVLQLAGRQHEAEKVAGEAFAAYEQKGNLVMAERARLQLSQLGALSCPTRSSD